MAALATVGALVVAGCGGGSSSSSSSNTSTSATSSQTSSSGSGGNVVNVSETDFKLNPSTPTVKPGTVAFKVKNNGQTTHSLEIEGPKGEVKLPSELQPGDSATLSADLTKPGKYEWYCPVPGHKKLGMKGTITVSASGAASSSGQTQTGTQAQSSGGGY